MSNSIATVKKSKYLPTPQFKYRMEKTPRYTQRERNMVLGFAAQYRDVIENKRTDAESNRKKDEVWRVISKEFNARVYHQRTSKQLRQLYKNMKLLLKKDLCNDGKSTKSFFDILTALSQQNSISQLLAVTSSNNSGTSRNNQKNDFDDNEKLVNSFNNAILNNDVVVIKSEDISDNEQSCSLRNGMDLDDDDDCLSTKDIPEVCLEEDDEELYHRSSPDLMTPIPNGKYLSDNANKSDFLLNLAIEERRKKIDLLNVQIDYWKTLTKKLENNGTNSIGAGINPIQTCHCHMSTQMNGINTVNQS